MNNSDYNNMKKEEQPFYSKYFVTDFEEQLENTKLSFKFKDKFEENDLYCELIEDE